MDVAEETWDSLTSDAADLSESSEQHMYDTLDRYTSMDHAYDTGMRK